jgi:hypothetical protein
MQAYDNTPTRAVSNKIPALKHCAQARLLLLREAIETRDLDLERALHDVAGILAHIITELEQLGRRTQ